MCLKGKWQTPNFWGVVEFTLGISLCTRRKKSTKCFLSPLKRKKRESDELADLQGYPASLPHNRSLSQATVFLPRSHQKRIRIFLFFFYLLKEYLEVSRSRNNHTVKAFYFISFYYFSFRVPENVLLTFVPLFDWNVTFSLFFLFLYRSITDMDDSKKPETNKTVKRKYEIPEVTEAETGRRTSSQIELRKRINKAMLNL